jgi:hypothetical protein
MLQRQGGCQAHGALSKQIVARFQRIPAHMTSTRGDLGAFTNLFFFARAFSASLHVSYVMSTHEEIYMF